VVQRASLADKHFGAFGERTEDLVAEHFGKDPVIQPDESFVAPGETADHADCSQ
jgi:hypothetical protein